MTQDFDLHSYIRGIRLFNEHKFFEAHEVLEDVWRAAPHDSKKFFQGLIQVAVALHHESRGNRVGAVSLLKRAARNLATYPEGFQGMHVPQLLQAISTCAEALEHGLPLPTKPRFDEPEC
jgi:uncharacterized protein